MIIQDKEKGYYFVVILADKKLKSAQTFVSLSLFVIIGPNFCGYGVHPSTPFDGKGG